MKRFFAATVLFVAITVFQMSCTQLPTLCASQQTRGGALLYEYKLGLNPSFVPRPLGYNSTGAGEEMREFLAPAGLCGQGICATDIQSARAAFAAAIGDKNPSDPNLWITGPYLTFADESASWFADNAAWNAAGRPCYNGLAPAPDDAGVDMPCGDLHSTCGVSSGEVCCASTQIAGLSDTSSLVCDDVSNECQVALGSPCAYGANLYQCQYGAVCGDAIGTQGYCCLDDNSGVDCDPYNPALLNAGCCSDYVCSPDTIGNGWSCQ